MSIKEPERPEKDSERKRSSATKLFELKVEPQRNVIFSCVRAESPFPLFFSRAARRYIRAI